MNYDNLQHLYEWNDEAEAFERECRELEQELVRCLERAPEGTLEVHLDRNRYRYYWAHDNHRHYLPKSQTDLARSLAQKRYDVAALRILKMRNQGKMTPKEFADRLSGLYDNLYPGRKALVRPILMSDKEYAKQWMAEEYRTLGFRENDPEHYSLKGLRVRSKSEAEIANLLDKYEIPFRYESALYLSGYREVYPDFCVLNVRTRRVYYWEHFGMMDSRDYILRNLQKLDAYHYNGYFEGKNLILTMESYSKTLNIKRTEDIVKNYLL